MVYHLAVGVSDTVSACREPRRLDPNTNCKQLIFVVDKLRKYTHRN
jgi:hypothetical protein